MRGRYVLLCRIQHCEALSARNYLTGEHNMETAKLIVVQEGDRAMFLTVRNAMTICEVWWHFFKRGKCPKSAVIEGGTIVVTF